MILLGDGLLAEVQPRQSSSLNLTKLNWLDMGLALMKPSRLFGTVFKSDATSVIMVAINSSDILMVAAN